MHPSDKRKIIGSIPIETTLIKSPITGIFMFNYSVKGKYMKQVKSSSTHGIQIGGHLKFGRNTDVDAQEYINPLGIIGK